MPEPDAPPGAPAGPEEGTTAGFVALIGAPNAGKSTLLNGLVGTKVSIVSRKVQTTRTLVRGIAMEGRAQIILVDTPGIFVPTRRLERAMVTSAWSGASDADAVCLLVDARRGVEAETEGVLARLPEVRRPKVLILNKIDLIERTRLLALAADLNGRLPFDHTFMVSALNGDGVGVLKATLAGMMPPSPWLYPEDQVSDAPLRMLAAEITAWMQLLALHHQQARRWEPKRLRYRLFTIPAALARTGRRVLLHLAERSPWARLVADATARLRALAVPG